VGDISTELTAIPFDDRPSSSLARSQSSNRSRFQGSSLTTILPAINQCRFHRLFRNDQSRSLLSGITPQRSDNKCRASRGVHPYFHPYNSGEPHMIRKTQWTNHQTTTVSVDGVDVSARTPRSTKVRIRFNVSSLPSIS